MSSDAMSISNPTQSARTQKRLRNPLHSKRMRGIMGAIIVHLVLLTGLVFILMPLAWSISTSLKEPGAVFTYPPEWIPRPVVWRNYIDAWTVLPFFRYLWNTTMITTFSIVGRLLACSLAAFAFSRLRWPGRDILFFMMLSTMMLPSQVTLIPTFILFRKLGWVNTFLPLIIPKFFAEPFFTFLMRQFFMTIPIQMDEAARIDGCTNFSIFSKIIMPLSKPVFIAVAIFVFNANWNDFFAPLIYLHDSDKFTLALGLRAFQGQFGTEWNLMMAASNLVLLPVVLLFFFAQKYFMQGVVITGLKG